MPESQPTIVNGVEINEGKAKQLLRWLLFAEKTNVKTKEKNDQRMIAAIQKRIEEVTQCY